MTIRLIQSGLRYRPEVLEMLSQMPEDEAGFLRGYGKITRVNIVGFLQRLYNASLGLYLEEGSVPSTTYWLMTGENWLESAGLRHELNEALEKRGGHCGYYVRPEYRGKGYATEIMAALKEEARRRGMKKILLTANYDNFASIEVIMHNGGVEDEPNGEVLRFWIDLNETEEVKNDVLE